MSETKVIKTV